MAPSSGSAPVLAESNSLSAKFPSDVRCRGPPRWALPLKRHCLRKRPHVVWTDVLQHQALSWPTAASRGRLAPHCSRPHAKPRREAEYSGSVSLRLCELGSVLCHSCHKGCQLVQFRAAWAHAHVRQFAPLPGLRCEPNGSPRRSLVMARAHAFPMSKTDPAVSHPERRHRSAAHLVLPRPFPVSPAPSP